MPGDPNEIRPYRVDVAAEVLDDLRDRLARTRWPDQIPGRAWGYGTDLETLQDLCAYWHDEFDWRAAEARLNEWPQFETDIDDIHIHFVHARSPEADALPLVITHGWPGSVAEFLKILGPLTDPAAHGGDAGDAFHVVAPSMPGYGFSGPTTRPGVDIRTVAEVNAALMARLGYDRYGAQGGDWGAMATTQLGHVDAPHLAGIHLNMVLAGPPKDADAMAGVLPEELDGIAAAREFRDEESGYQAIQGTKPQTLAYGLTDSPAGLAGWILEKFRTWSDCGGDVYSRFTRDELLTNITIYWVTGTINASTRMYCESRRSGRFGAVAQKVKVPTGAAIFPKELFRPPRVWAEAAYDIVQWTRMPSGGHFAAMEEPEALVDDMRAFFRQVR
jgi:pimeloyl-ACP methyl ester carboxylesterase